MSFLRDASVLHGSASASCYGDTTSAPSNNHKRVRKAQSYSLFGRLSPLVDLVRDPVGALGSAVGGLTQPSPEETAAAEREKQADGERRLLYLRMRAAATLDEWRSCATQLDLLEGNNTWREQDTSTDYDHELVAARLRQLDDARISCDLRRMMFLIRTALTRGLGGMGDLRLYQHSHLGTKKLIERYIESCRATISAVVELSAQSGPEMEAKKVMDDMIYARQAFGRSALLLSGGGTFGMNHIGVIKTLWEAKLLPRIISGSSAGSIVCAVLCTRTDDELPQTLRDFCHGDLAVFEPEGEENGILPKLARLLKYGAVFEVDHLVRVMKGLLGDMTFQEAYNRTRRILNICVSSPGVYELPRLLNYITSPNVIIWSAVAASCSVPLIFQAATIYAKDPRTGQLSEWHGPGLSPQRWIDGSVDNDIPITRLAEMFNVNHFIVSQVNPHVVPFLAKEDDLLAHADLSSKEDAPAVEAGPGWLHTMANLAKGEALHRMHVLAELGIFPTYMTKARSVLSQRYSGDITILPAVSYAQFPRVLRNPTPDFMEAAMLCGERATWPKLSRISNHCAIELALDEAVHNLRSRVAFSPSQVDLRMAIYANPSDRYRDLRRHRSSRSVEPTKKQRRDRGQTYPPKRKGPLHLPPDLDTLQPPSGSKFAMADILSSSAADSMDESGVGFTSDDESDASSSLDSPPEQIPTQSLHFRSQPATPSIASRAFLSNASSPLTMKTTAKHTSSQAAPTSPSEPEKRYKRLFHPQRRSSSNIVASPPPGAALTEEPESSSGKPLKKSGSGLRLPLKKMSDGLGLSLKTDPNSTRGLIGRKSTTTKR